MANACPPEQGGGEPLSDSVNTMELINLMEEFTKKAPAWIENCRSRETQKSEGRLFVFFEEGVRVIANFKNNLVQVFPQRLDDNLGLGVSRRVDRVFQHGLHILVRFQVDGQPFTIFDFF
jgi:hypothetical protein